ncbi:hypothetical protein GWI33_002055 [Rhynchophorus ferrugineus]|uniref:Uncharacterized protein n=1 Tax=Rhynchophorus ferrugineus TaxID=354439 RepID=A0A834MLN5_RHYFE|nr:hypothetical protein GWI33_002055 [Rhynchophorus ferrugineus]
MAEFFLLYTPSYLPPSPPSSTSTPDPPFPPPPPSDEENIKFHTSPEEKKVVPSQFSITPRPLPPSPSPPPPDTALGFKSFLSENKRGEGRAARMTTRRTRTNLMPPGLHTNQRGGRAAGWCRGEREVSRSIFFR